jgi:predicted transcriptional regulator
MRTSVLLPIKPQFAQQIFVGTKQYEFRKTIFRNKDIRRIIVYASAPTSKVIGEFEIDAILQMDKEHLWEQTKDLSGITKAYFDKYFEEKSIGCAIKISKPRLYQHPFDLQAGFGIRYAPQSFVYLSSHQTAALAQPR